ncbi:ribosome assembly factor SBDS [Nanoarchaeota archaeon]
MTLIEDAVVARLQSGKSKFEILVDCEKALALKEGKNIDISEVLVDDKVFSDSKKGLVVAQKELENIFGTSEINEVAKQIIEKGKVHTTSEHRDKERDEKWKRIASLIHTNGVDPKTGIPHPLERVENAMREAKVNIDGRKAEDQFLDVIKALKVIIPISFETRQIELVIPPKHTGPVFPVVKKMATIQRDEWKNDGSLHLTAEIPAGLRDEFMDKLNALTHGEIEIKILK